MKNIDTHSHMIPRETVKELSGEILQRDGDGLYSVIVDGINITPITKGFFDLPSRITEIDQCEVDNQIISPNHALFFYNKKPEEAVRGIKVQNDGIADVCRTDPSRFYGTASLPLQDQKASLAELDRAYSKLEVKGIEIGTNIAGVNLDDEVLFPIYEKAQDLELPIFVHPNDFLLRGRIGKYYQGAAVGTLAETTLGIACLLFGGVLDKFNKLKMMFCHGGGAIPYQMARLRHTVKVRDELKGSGIDIDRVLKNIFYDTIMFDHEGLAFLIQQSGKDNVVLGTDYPFNVGNWNSVKDLNSLPSISDSDRKQIAYENARKLYKI